MHDLILLYTDGVYEVEGPGSDEFGQDRLLHVIRRNARLNTDALLDTVLTEVQAFSGTTEFEDDVCLVAVEVARLGV